MILLIKLIKEIITSKLFIFIFLASLFALCAYSIKYSKTNNTYNALYNISYSQNIDDYDEEIIEYKEKIEALNESYYSKEDYELYKKYFENAIVILENLKEHNKDYSTVYDFGSGKDSDFLLYLINSESILTFIILLNGIVLIYLLFSREFDSGIYSMVYSNTRYKFVLKKIAVFLLFLIFEMVIFICFNLFVSKMLMDKTFSEVLILHDKNIKYISIKNYIFNFNISLIAYRVFFVLFLVLAFELLFRKSIYMVLSSIIICALFIILYFLNQNITASLGLSINFDTLSFNTSIIIRFLILVPFSLLIFSIFKFEKIDL